MRSALSVATFSIMLAGAIALGLTFIGSMSPSDATEQNYTIDLRKIPPGQIAKLEFRNHPVWVLRRTKEMVKIQGNIPDREVGEIPNWWPTKNKEFEKSPFRSTDPEYFVFYPQGGLRDCEVRIVHERPPEVNEEYWASGFIDPCSNIVYDTAGRNYSFNWSWYLYVPDHKWISKGVLKLGT